MAQLKSTTINGNLSVTGNISNPGLKANFGLITYNYGSLSPLGGNYCYWNDFFLYAHIAFQFPDNVPSGTLLMTFPASTTANLSNIGFCGFINSTGLQHIVAFNFIGNKMYMNTNRPAAGNFSFDIVLPR